jgi:hypothetical protein
MTGRSRYRPFAGIDGCDQFGRAFVEHLRRTIDQLARDVYGGCHPTGHGPARLCDAYAWVDMMKQ